MGFFDAIRERAAQIKNAAAPETAYSDAAYIDPGMSANTPEVRTDPNKGMPNVTGGNAPSSGGGNVNTNYGQIQQFIQQWQASHPPTKESMDQMVAALNQAGYPVTTATRAGGSAASGDKLVMPDGMVVDLIGDEGGRNASWTYNANPNDRFGGDHMVVGPDGQFVKYSDYLNQRNLPIPQATPGAGGVGAPPGGGGFGGLPQGYDMGGYYGGEYPLSGYNGPGLMQPFTAGFNNPGDFRAPGYHEVGDDPAYQFRMKEGEQAIQRSAAAKGTLLTGGTLKDLAAYAQGLASEEYDKIYGRRLGENNLAYNRAWNRYTNAQDIFDRNRRFGYDALSGVANTGLNAASGYARTATDLETGKGNSQSAGTVTSGQNSANLTQNIADTAGGLAGMIIGSRGSSGSKSSAPATPTAPVTNPLGTAPVNEFQGPMPPQQWGRSNYDYSTTYG